MGINELKERLRDIPGIENLTMRLEQGNQVFSVGGAFASVHPGATDEEIDNAIRSVAVVRDVTAALSAGTVSPEAVAAVVNAPAASSAALIPAVDLVPATQPAADTAPQAGGKPVSNPSAAMNAIDAVMAQHVKNMETLIAGQVAQLQVSCQRQIESLTRGMGGFAGGIDKQTDDFEAMFARYSNHFGSGTSGS